MVKVVRKSRKEGEEVRAEKQRLERAELARERLKIADRNKLKKLIGSAIYKYWKESGDILDISKEQLNDQLKNSKGKPLITLFQKRLEDLQLNDEDIISLMSIILNKSQIKNLEIGSWSVREVIPKRTYTEMTRYIKQNATRVEPENTSLKDVIVLIATQNLDDIQSSGLLGIKEPQEEGGKGGKGGKEPEEEPKQGKVSVGQKIDTDINDVLDNVPAVIEMINRFTNRHENAVGSYRKGTGKKWARAFNKLRDYIEEGKEKRNQYTSWYAGTPQFELFRRLAILYNSKDYTFDSVLKVLEDLNLTDEFASQEDINKFKEKIALKPDPEPETEEEEDEDDDDDDSNGDKPKGAKEGIDVEVEVPAQPGQPVQPAQPVKPAKPEIGEPAKQPPAIERPLAIERQQLTQEEQDAISKMINNYQTNQTFAERVRQGQLQVQQGMINAEPIAIRAVSPEELNLISSTYHIRVLLDRYLGRETDMDGLMRSIVKAVTGRSVEQLREEGKGVPQKSIEPSKSGAEDYGSSFETETDPDKLYNKVIGYLSDDDEQKDDNDDKKAVSIFAPDDGDDRKKVPQPSGVTTQKIKVPQDWSENKQAKGTLRPKFISPSVNVLQPSEQDIQADFDEWAIFDFVQPVNNYGTEGNLENNPLKRMSRVEEETRYRNAGIDLDPSLASVFTNGEVNTSQQAMAMDMLPPLMPDTSSQPRQVYDVSEYEVKSYDVNNDRTAIEYQSPYDNMTPIVLTNDEIRRSVLYGRVP